MATRIFGTGSACFMLALCGCNLRPAPSDADRAAYRTALAAAGAELSALKACRDSRAVTLDRARLVEIREARFSHLVRSANEIGLGDMAGEVNRTPGKGPVDCDAGFEPGLDRYDRRDRETLEIILRLEREAAG